MRAINNMSKKDRVTFYIIIGLLSLLLGNEAHTKYVAYQTVNSIHLVCAEGKKIAMVHNTTWDCVEFNK